MKIKFTQAVELEIIRNYYEDGDYLDSVNETFFEGDTLEIDLLVDESDCIDCQAGDGSVILSLDKNLFEVI